jgi:hypothetical protein
MLDTGFSMPDTGCSITGYWILVLVTDHWILIAGCCSLVNYLLFVMLTPLYITLHICNQASISIQMKVVRGQMADDG